MKRYSALLLLLPLLLLLANIIEVNAMDTGFQTTQLSSEDKNMFISNINILTIDEEPVKKPIICFDVNSNQLIAIGQNTSDRKTICIYSNEGVFQYGYTFYCTGDFGVEWDGENLNIYFVRSGVIASVTPQGEVLDVLEIPNTTENTSHTNHFIHSTHREIGETRYRIDNNLGMLNVFALSYSQVIVTNSEGVESVIYDVGSTQLLNIIVTICIVCVSVLLAVVVIARNFVKLRRGN